MEQEEIRTLKILEALSEDPIQTQRDLSKRLKISLGLVNSFTKRLAKKGYFKITTIPKNRLRYVLTAKGLSEKANLTYRYILHSVEFYKETRVKINSLLNRLSNQNKKCIYLFGVSELAEIVYMTLQESDLCLKGIIDEELAGCKFMGMTIKELFALKQLPTDAMVLITKINDVHNIESLLLQYGLKKRNILSLNG
jgi:DNA-binding MarR family transcriptional regulator